MNQEIEIKHLEASVLLKRGQNLFLNYGDISQISVCMNQEIEIKHLEASDFLKRGQNLFLNYGDISQSSVCMNQEIEIKHLEASDLLKRGRNRFLNYGDISQSSMCMNQEIEIKHLEASDIGDTYLCARKLYRVSEEECARLREGVLYVKVYRYNPKHLCPNLNGYGDNGQRSLKVGQLLHTY